MKERRDFINSGQRYHFLMFIGIFFGIYLGGVGVVIVCYCMHCIYLRRGFVVLFSRRLLIKAMMSFLQLIARGSMSAGGYFLDF